MGQSSVWEGEKVEVSKTNLETSETIEKQESTTYEECQSNKNENDNKMDSQEKSNGVIDNTMRFFTEKVSSFVSSLSNLWNSFSTQSDQDSITSSDIVKRETDGEKDYRENLNMQVNQSPARQAKHNQSIINHCSSHRYIETTISQTRPREVSNSILSTSSFSLS